MLGGAWDSVAPDWRSTVRWWLTAWRIIRQKLARNLEHVPYGPQRVHVGSPRAVGSVSQPSRILQMLVLIINNLSLSEPQEVMVCCTCATASR